MEHSFDSQPEPHSPPEVGPALAPAWQQWVAESGVSRRAFLSGGVVGAIGLVISGCQTQGGYTKTAGPVWPDQEGRRSGSAGQGARAASSLYGSAPGVASSGYYQPETGVIPRREWARGGPIRSLSNPMNGIQRITIHHEGEPISGITNRVAIARRLEGIRQWHIGARNGWADIGYHYVIDPAGRVWEGRPLSLQGAHVKDNNENNLGIMLMGDFNQQRPTGEQITTLSMFVPQQMRRFRVPIGRVYTHRELMPTACPGRNLQSFMIAARSRGGRFTVNA